MGVHSLLYSSKVGLVTIQVQIYCSLYFLQCISKQANDSMVEMAVWQHAHCNEIGTNFFMLTNVHLNVNGEHCDDHGLALNHIVF